jgi:hypothetical protein
MLIHCCVGYLKVTNVQNSHHRHQRIVDNGVEESVLLLVEDIPHHTDVTGQLTASSSVTF